MNTPLSDLAKWRFWLDSLAWRKDPKGEPPAFDPRKPEQGYYRGQRNEAVAIWWIDHNGQLECRALVKRQDRAEPTSYDRADHIGEMIFGFCCRHPITFEAYKRFIATNRWDEQVEAPPPVSRETPGPGHNQPPMAPEEAFRAELDALIEQATQWLNSIDRKIDTQEKADKAANYATLVQRLEDRIEDARKAEKRELDDAIAAIQRRFKPVLDRTAEVKRRLKDILLPWLSAQRRKQNEEKAKALAKRMQTIKDGGVPDPQPYEASRSVAGTQGGRVSLRTKTVTVIDDLPAAAAYLAALREPPADFIEAVSRAAGRLMAAGADVPGARQATEETVA